jgi:hypothetical protein
MYVELRKFAMGSRNNGHKGFFLSSDAWRLAAENHEINSNLVNNGLI